MKIIVFTLIILENIFKQKATNKNKSIFIIKKIKN